MAFWCLFIIAFWLSQGCAAHIVCSNDYIKDVTCIWPAKPDTDCSTDYTMWYQMSDSLANCSEITDMENDQGSSCQCKFGEQPLVFGAVYKIRVEYNKSEIFNTTFEPSQTIKPLAAYNLTIDISNDKNILLSWVDDYSSLPLGKYIEYEVAYMRTGGNWKMVRVSNEKTLRLNPFVEAGYTYRMRVHSRTTDNYRGTWSDWSSVIEWSYNSRKWILPTIIVLVCIFIPLPVATCFYTYQLAKKSWWEKIPSPLKSSVSKQIFNQPQMKGLVFSENKIDDCKVEKISCMKDVSREKAKVDDPTEHPGTDSVTFPAFQPLMKDIRHDEKSPFPHFPGFGFPVLMDIPSLFPLPVEDLSLVPSDAPGYSLFNGIAKDQWADEGDGYRPFNSTEDGTLRLTLSTYSLSPGPGKEASQAPEQVGYQTFNSCVSKPWVTGTEGEWDPGEQSSEALLTPLDPSDVESSEYMASSNWPFPADGKEPDGEGNDDHHASYNFTVASGNDFLLHPFPLFPERLPSTTFQPSLPGKMEFQEPPSIHWGPCMSLSLAPSLYPPEKVALS
ncbi:uncharacterized protein [Mobula birostris]|uniref:uncharacterized protein n=1 Tax=Mobula birostris TaxID=1983395 RepID=UPI003B285A83